MQASRWFAVWMAVGALGIASTGAGCSEDTPGTGATANSTTTTTGEGGSGAAGTGGSGAAGTGGSGAAGTGGSGAAGTGGSGAAGTGGSGAAGTGGDGGFGAGGAGGSEGQGFNFVLRGTGYVPAYSAGDMVYVDVVAVGETVATLRTSDPIDADGTFMVTGQVLGGKAYKMHWYVDLEELGSCQEELDSVWTQDIPTVTADVTRSVVPNDAFGACPPVP